jgi:CheY-like chemotaxis protein
VSGWWIHDDYRQLQAQLLNCEPGVECARRFPSAAAVLAALGREPAPDAILLDVEMPGMTGIEAIKPVKKLAPSASVLMLTTFFGDYVVHKQLRGGTGRAATSGARVGAGATKARRRRHKIPPPDAALGDGVFAARKLPPLFVNDIVPLFLTPGAKNARWLRARWIFC